MLNFFKKEGSLGNEGSSRLAEVNNSSEDDLPDSRTTSSSFDKAKWERDKLIYNMQRESAAYVAVAVEAAAKVACMAAAAEEGMKYNDPKETFKNVRETLKSAVCLIGILKTKQDIFDPARIDHLEKMKNKANDITDTEWNTRIGRGAVEERAGATRAVEAAQTVVLAAKEAVKTTQAAAGGAKKKNHIISANIRGKRKSKKRRYTRSAKIKKSRKKRKSRRHR